jgi:hypothetical protein
MLLLHLNWRRGNAKDYWEECQSQHDSAVAFIVLPTLCHVFLKSHNNHWVTIYLMDIFILVSVCTCRVSVDRF